MIQRRQAFRLVVAALAVAAFVACNVFVSLDRCKGDGDCPVGSTCDPEGKFCVRAEAGLPDTGPDVADGGASADADADAAAAPCDVGKPFGKASLVAGLEGVEVLSARLTPNETTALLSLAQDAGDFRTDLHAASRAGLDAGFVLGAPLANVNEVESAEYWPTITADGKLLFFESSRSLTEVDGGFVNDFARIWSAERPAGFGAFNKPKIDPLFATDGAVFDTSPYLHPGGGSLYFVSLLRTPNKGNGAGGASFDIYVARFDTLGLVSTIENVDVVNSESADLHPLVSLDDKVLYFAREVGGASIRDVFVSKRAQADAGFAPPVPVSELNTEFEEFPTWLSDDQCRIYFISNRPTDGGSVAGFYHLWMAQRP